MKIEIEEINKDKNNNFFEINLSENLLKKLKRDYADFSGFKIGFETLNLGNSLYGNSKKESIKIQKRNCKIILKLYRKCVSLIRFLIRKNINFNGNIYRKFDE